MSDLEQFSGLIGDIYDAALDPALWSGVFKKACNFIGTTAATLASVDVLRSGTIVYYHWGLAPGYDDVYVKKWSKLNPFFPTATFFDLETVHAPIPECVPRDEFCQSLFAREWVAPQGLVDALVSNLEKSPITCVGFWIFRRFNEGFANEETRRRFALVVPHIRRAVAIGQVIDLKTIEAAALADSFDTLPAGMFLVDAVGRIVHANLRGHVMVSEANVLNARGGKLGAIDPEADQALLDAFTAADSGDGAMGRRGLAVPLKARDGTRYVANVLPLTSGARRKAGVLYSAVATVFVHKAELDLPSPPEAIAREFRLTPAELRVLFAIIEVGSVHDVSEVLGIGEPTVRTHLQRLFDKTSTHRQADLVKLVAGYANALLV
jgi:DNA-binding CsgD family transcriptional regulator